MITAAGMSIDEAITYALADVRAARLRAELYPHPDTTADVDTYQRVLDGLLDDRRAYYPPEEAP